MTASNKQAIVIGAGLGGIGAAVSLAASGWRVRVFEKNGHTGGKLNVLQKDGFSFDLGPSILTYPQVFESLFERAGRRFEDYVSTQAVKPHWRNFFEDGPPLDLYPGAQETVSHSDELTREDASDLERFLEYSRRLYTAFEPSYFRKGLDGFWEMMRYHAKAPSTLLLEPFRSMDASVGKRIRNRHLRMVLDFFVKYVGSSAFDAPAVLNLMCHIQSEFGLWYVSGGLYGLALGMRRLMEDLGIELHTDTEVVEILSEGSRVRGVRLADGSEASAEVVVCNMEVIPAHRSLLGESEKQLRRFRRFEPACSGLVLHLGVSREYPHLAHHNFFFSRNPKKHFDSVFRKKTIPDDPTVYVVAPARTDRSQAPDGCENLKILPHIPHVQNPPFARAEYDALKQRVLDKLERMGLEDLRRHVVVEHMWVPEDIERLYYSNRGAIYGVVSHRRKNFGFKAPKRSDRFGNLWFVGGSVNPGGGMPMALLSGQQAADRIIQSEGH